MVVNVSLNNRHSKVPIDMTSQVDINSKTKSIVIPANFLCVDDGDGFIVLNLTQDLAHEMCQMMSVSMYLSNAYSVHFRTL